MTQRMTPDDRKEQIIAAAMHLARKGNYKTITREQIAAQLGISKALVTRYFDFETLQNTVVQRACREHDAVIVAQAVGHGNAWAKRAIKRDETLRDVVSARMFA